MQAASVGPRPHPEAHTPTSAIAQRIETLMWARRLDTVCILRGGGI
jgi:hypothetical protein